MALQPKKSSLVYALTLCLLSITNGLETGAACKVSSCSLEKWGEIRKALDDSRRELNLVINEQVCALLLEVFYYSNQICFRRTIFLSLLVSGAVFLFSDCRYLVKVQS